MLCVVLLNEVPADHSDLAAQLTADWLARAAAALQTQLQRDVAPMWPYAKDAVVRVGAGPSDLGATETPCRVMTTLDVPDAIAYHDDANGYPDEFLGLDTCNGLPDVTSAISHENDEVSGDPNCDQWVTIPSGLVLPQGLVAGMQIAFEVSDPLQDRSYEIDGISVSDFVYPAYFDPTLSGPTSYGEAQGGLRLEPFARTSGGYQIARQGDGSGETQFFGYMPEHKKKRARHHRSRQFRRGLRLAA